MGLYDFFSKTKKKVGETVSSLGATARQYSSKLKDTLNAPAPKVLQNTIGKLPDAYDVAKPAYDFLGSINTRPLSSRASSPLGKLAGGIVETPYTFLTSVPKTYGQTMNEIGKGTIFSKGGVKRTAGRVLESGLDTASMGLLSKGAKLAKAGAKSVAESVVTRQAPKVGNLIREGAKQGAKIGAGYGGAYGGAEALKEEKGAFDAAKDIVTGGATGAVLGGAFGGGLPAAGALAKAVKHDISKKKAPTDVIPTHKTFRETTVGSVPIAFQNSGVRSFSPESVPKQVQQDIPLVPTTLREVGSAMPRFGMGIEDVSQKPPLVPSNKNTQRARAVNAAKNQAAAEAVAKMPRGAVAKPKETSIPTTPTKTPARRGNDMESGTPEERFAKSLDEIPTPWGGKASDSPISTSIERDLKEMKVKGLDKKVMNDLFGEVKPFNKYQQRAFEEKGRRIKSIGEVLNASPVLRAMGFTKAEAKKLGVKEAEVVERLGKLGYSKDHPAVRDPYSDQTKRILEHGVPFQRLKEYYAQKHSLDTKVLDGIDPSTLQDISPLQAGTRDVYRNFETVFGGKYNDPTFQKVKKELLDPFDASKGAFIEEQQKLLKELDENIVQKLGIKKGSKLSEAVQLYGEGKMPIEELKAKFPNDWNKVIEADKWFRNMYDSMLDETNRIREYYFPTHPLFPESSKIIPKRKDYYRHFTEMADGFRGLLNIFDTPANIDPELAVSSQYTKPLSKFLSFALRREGDKSTNDAVGGFLDYIKANSYAKHIDPHIRRFRGVDKEAEKLFPGEDSVGLAEELSRKVDPMSLIAGTTDEKSIVKMLSEKGLQTRDAVRMARDLAGKNTIEDVRGYLTENLTPEGLSSFSPTAPAEKAKNNLNNFLKFLDNFANDLAGKTNPLDRPIQDNFLGRQAFRAINWVNSQVKANVILGNAGSALAQFFAIPGGIANAGPKNATLAVGDSLAGILAKNAPSSRSTFLNERYFRGYDRFDPGIVSDAKRSAIWLTSIGDKIGTTFSWNAQYRKALSEGLSGDDAIKYADDWTRRVVSGRGVGEVPIMQKSKLFQIVAPFQLEVAGLWRLFGDWARNDPQKLGLAKKLMVYSVSVGIMNHIVKELRGSDVAFDPIRAMEDAYASFNEEEDKAKGAGLAAGRIAGEVLSNIPGGMTIAQMYPEYGRKDVMGTGIDFPTREKLFGDKDPTRFGGGLLASRALTDPAYMLLPFGGKQIKNTIEGAGTLLDGYAETAAGNVMTPVDQSARNIAQGLVFGKNALPEMQDYRESNRTPLSEDQSLLFKKSGGTPYYNSVMERRDKERERNKIIDERKKSVREMMEAQPEGESPEFGAPEQLEQKTLALPGVSVASASSEIAQKATEDLEALPDGSFFVKDVGKYGTFFETREEARFGKAKALLEKSPGTDFVDMGDYILKKEKKAGPGVSITALTPEEGKIEMTKAELKKSKESYFDDGQHVYLKAKNGDVTAKPKDEFTLDLNDKRMNFAKDVKDFAKWRKYAEESFSLLNTMLENPALNEFDRLVLTDKKETLMRDFAKYRSYGGSFTKGRKLEEKFRYPLIDKDMLKVQSLLSGAGGSAKPRVDVRPLRLIPVRPRKVRRYRRRRK